jgi:hypothetical protein
MMSVLVSLLLTLRSWARSRAALQLEVLALRHQLHVLQRSRLSLHAAATLGAFTQVVACRGLLVICACGQLRHAIVMAEPRKLYKYKLLDRARGDRVRFRTC